MQARLPSTLGTCNAVLATLVGLALAACSGATKSSTCTTTADCEQGSYCSRGTCTQPGGDTDPAGGLCSSDLQCGAEEFCDGGECRPRGSVTPGDDDGCHRHEDCPAAQFCKPTGVCVDCLNEQNCHPGEVCRVDGSCGAGQAPGCTSDSQCAGLKCNTATGKCVECLETGQCKPGYTCRAFVCSATTPTVECDENSDCSALGKVCDIAKGVCVECVTPQDCDDGEQCTVNVCMTPPTDPTSACTRRDQCGGRACFGGVCQPCYNDEMCIDPSDAAAAARICDINNGMCIEPECKNADNCAAGQGCYAPGHCGPCEKDGECREGEVCDVGTKICHLPQPAAFGEHCAGTAECEPGHLCLFINNVSICTRPCVGSGGGGTNDCPLGYACYNFESGVLDGMQLCVAAAQLSSSVAGQPFNQAPGSTCDPAGNNHCQTGVCFPNKTCARGCVGNGDCPTGDICYAVWSSDTQFGGQQQCYDSKVDEGWLAAGAICHAGVVCDSGICTGSCTGGGACNHGGECATGQSCTGNCRDHCRANADCPTGQACMPWPMRVAASGESGWVPTCMPKLYNGTGADGSMCDDDSQCKSDWCVEGLCTTMCATTADCVGGLAGKQCLLVTFTNGGLPAYSGGFCLSP